MKYKIKSLYDNINGDIKSSILEDGEKTRALITSNRIADLQDQLDTARASVANFTQTQTILNSLGRYVPFSNCGCGVCCNNNLI